MVYLWAALRTIAILVGLAIVLCASMALAASIIGAFKLWGWIGASIVLASVAAVISLFGHQLAKAAEKPGTRQIGGYVFVGFAAIAAISAAAPLASYILTSIIPPLTNLLLRPLSFLFGDALPIESATVANLVFWFVLFPIANFLVMTARSVLWPRSISHEATLEVREVWVYLLVAAAAVGIGWLVS